MAGMNVVMSTAAPTARELRQSEELVKVRDVASPLSPLRSPLPPNVLTCILALLHIVAAVASLTTQTRFRVTNLHLLALQFLRDEGLYETREELERREDVLGRLSELAQVQSKLN